MASLLVASFVFLMVGVAVGIYGQKPTPAPPAPTPKIFGRLEFENLVAAIPPTADEQTKKLVVTTNTSLVVGFLGFEDRVVQETEEAIAKNLVAVRQNDERIASLSEEISLINTSISELESHSAEVQARINTLAELKKLKTN
ncbi:MAG: hypothetical protein HYT63_03405 [Candidatus Yanofskybacteria bacterium]|nr:hypothetical protein [Candidatus Yanofskybacteria bacterium]